MDSDTWRTAGLVLLFVVVGGLFAGTELALVSLRESQLAQLERRGARGRRAAALARNPTRFLAAVQIGITVTGFFSAAYGAATLAPDLAPALVRLGLSAPAAQTAAVVLLTLVIAYLSLVLGELVPKRLALQRATGVAIVAAPVLDRFAGLVRPVVWALSASTDAVVRLVGGDPAARAEQISDEELRELVVTHEGLEDDERRIVHDVLGAGRHTLADVMRPRGEVVVLAADLSVAEVLGDVHAHPYSRYPVTGDGIDDVIGYLHVRDLLGAAPDTPVGSLARTVPAVPGTAALLPTLATMRRQGTHLAVVVDEYGGTDGIVTLEDVIEELVGDIRDEYDRPSDLPAQRSGAVLRVDATCPIADFAEITGVHLAPGPYRTVAGYVVDRLGRLARVGDKVAGGGAELVVAQVGVRRVLRVDVTLPDAADAQ